MCLQCMLLCYCAEVRQLAAEWMRSDPEGAQALKCISLSLSLYIHVYIYIYIYVCMCISVLYMILIYIYIYIIYTHI